MLRQHGEARINALTDGDAGHHHDELRPAEAFVHLEHGLDIDVGLARARLYLHIQRAGTEAVGGRQGLAQRNVVLHLLMVDVLQQLIGVEFHIGIAVTHILLLKLSFQLLFLLAQVAAVLCVGLRGLSREHTHRAFHRIGLILLYFEFEFHGCYFNLTILVS